MKRLAVSRFLISRVSSIPESNEIDSFELKFGVYGMCKLAAIAAYRQSPMMPYRQGTYNKGTCSPEQHRD